MGLYKSNKKAKVGEMIECPICHRKFKKIQYSQAFCSSRCKDKFHNNIDGDRHKYSQKEEYPYIEADNDQWGDCELGIHD
jgi:protein-arginine kinase activator protein McsA